jgi:hypothetical protein
VSHESGIKRLQRASGVALMRGWILDGPGPARWGYGRLAPCKTVWLGRTLAEAAHALGVSEKAVDAADKSPDTERRRAATGRGFVPLKSRRTEP